MKRYTFQGELFDNLVVFSDDRFGYIRILTEKDNTHLYVAIDVVRCMGYKAPGKAVMRSNIPTEKKWIPRVFSKKCGATYTHCFNEKSARNFIERGQEVPFEFKKWFYEEVIPEAQKILYYESTEDDNERAEVQTQNAVCEGEKVKAKNESDTGMKMPLDCTDPDILEKIDAMILDLYELKKVIKSKQLYV